MSDQRNVLNICNSYHHTSVSPKSELRILSKSVLDCSLTTSSPSNSSNGTNLDGTRSFPECTKLVHETEYYRKYEHDEVPVKDSDIDVSKNSPYNSLTNSDLDVLEKRIYKNVSQELQTDDGSLSSLELNIKFFKITVEKIFENFYTSMSDFEHYKQRFHEILNKSKESSIDDMEVFIKDMFDHIMSSENSLTKISQHSAEIVTELEEKAHVSSCGDSAVEHESSKEFLEAVEAFKNENYRSDSTHGSSSKSKKMSDLEEKLNIFLLTGSPCIEINLIRRNMLSEVNLREPSPQKKTQSIASADNLNKIAAKRLELEKYMRHEHDSTAVRNLPDRDIPVKNSFAKKNIHLNEDFSRIADNESSKSLLSKFCSLFCRKFRRTSGV